ncbi:MAG: PAS domain-containing protein [Paracoccaceae bacterium]
MADGDDKGHVPQVNLNALTRAPFSMVVTNPNIDDNPIVYVNRAFEQVTGYSRVAAIGRNCRFLQCERTDPETVQTLRDAIAARREVTVDMVNARADGSEFWNRLLITPLEDEAGDIPYFLGVQMALPDPPEARARFDAEVQVALSEVQHRVKNHLSMIVGMIRMQAREASEDASADFATLSRRVEALQLLYEEFSATPAGGDGGNDDRIALGAYLTRVANAIAHIDGRRGVRVNIDADAITVAFSTATQVGLVLSEVMTNALQHGFEGREQGLLEVRLKALSDGVARLQVSDDGVGLPEGSEWPEGGNLGSRIVRQLVTGLQAKLSVARGASGTIVTLDVPDAPG